MIALFVAALLAGDPVTSVSPSESKYMICVADGVVRLDDGKESPAKIADAVAAQCAGQYRAALVDTTRDAKSKAVFSNRDLALYVVLLARSGQAARF